MVRNYRFSSLINENFVIEDGIPPLKLYNGAPSIDAGRREGTNQGDYRSCRSQHEGGRHILSSKLQMVERLVRLCLSGLD